MITLNDFYGLQQTPFTKSIATQNLYPSRDHQEVQARRINNFCRNALLLGASEGKQILDETDLQRVILDLEDPTS